MPEPQSKHSLAQRLFLFLGTMELAITLLLVLAIASVIGTVLQQNQPYTDYLIKFGPFWFDLFEAAGLYDVYSALWFLAILTLLVVSTTVCLIQQTPTMLRDMWNLRTHVQEKSLKAMQHSQQWEVSSSKDKSLGQVTETLKQEGFRVKHTVKETGVLLSAMRGGMNRLGYIFTHLAIVIICLGGLLDSNLPLKFAEWQGTLKIETRDLATRDIPNISRLSVGTQAFRGSVSIPEGRSSEVVFLAMRDGYLVQHLPFKLKVKDFRIEHYATGQPKSFETDLLLYDDALEHPISTTISVNHPLIYKGYAIYQASFSDGGTGLSLEAWPLDNNVGNAPLEFDAKVFENRQMQWAGQSVRLEILSFRPFNINPDPTEEEPNNLRNFGPSFGFKLRTETGEAKEYLNYMLPVPRKGRNFYLSGVRSSPAEEFAYLYLPIDADGGLTAFNTFLQDLHDKDVVSTIAREMVLSTLTAIENEDQQLAESLQNTLTILVSMFTQGGFTEVANFIETTLPKADRATLGPAYLTMLREMLARVYFKNVATFELAAMEQQQLLFLQDSVDAVGSLSRYSAPVYFELTDFEHVEASGLQITHSPGKPIVYFGCAFLIIGVFLLFYLPQRRLWILVKGESDKSVLLLAGMSNRNPREFDLFFAHISEQLNYVTGNSKA